MAGKEQKRGNREAKKPKQKPAPVVEMPLLKAGAAPTQRAPRKN